MNNVQRSKEINENISYLGMYNTRQKADLTDRNVTDLRERTQKVCYRINSAIQHDHILFEGQI